MNTEHLYRKSTALTVVLGLTGLIGGTSLASAQAVYPEKSLQLLVPFPPGGASDVLARIFGGELETRLGKPAVIMNHPGGGTTIAAKEAARAAPDGYTLFYSSNSSFTLPAAVKESVPYDAARDFEPIGRKGQTTLALVTYRDNPINDVASLVTEAKANRTSCRRPPSAWRPSRISPASCSSRPPGSRWCTCPTRAVRRR